MNILDSISKKFFAYLYGFGAIDVWLGRGAFSCGENNGCVHVLTDAGIAELAGLFEDLRYPGVDLADAALDEAGDCPRTWYFRCVDSIKDNNPSFSLLDFYRDCKTSAFYYPRGIHPLLKKIKRGTLPGNPSVEQIDPLQIIKDRFDSEIDHTLLLMDAALILAKYFDADADLAPGTIENIAVHLGLHGNSMVPSKEHQRVFLSELITSPNPWLGLELLKASGFIGKFWKELAIIENADHSKDFHPEGNAWVHTMETFRHRKVSGGGRSDLRLSLGLLLHDSGKPIAPSTSYHRYDGHAELGEMQARRFLERLGFGASITKDICFLVRNHMLPAALPRLPLFRTEQIMSSPLFPLLMELYRCDESSSFKGLDCYYESSAVYQQFLRNKRNPYRSLRFQN
ncbi:MAG: HD domain-containing protein [Treponema sp.]|nr:HD domain-containing protein [Treponema sp.]